MAAAPPPMSTQPTPMQTDPAGPSQAISWEGDKMCVDITIDRHHADPLIVFCFSFRAPITPIPDTWDIFGLLGSTSIFTITATNAASAELRKSFCRRPRSQPTLRLRSTPDKAYSSSAFSPHPLRFPLFRAFRANCVFRWWSVFWVLFQAKSNGGGSDDGLMYINVSRSPYHSRHIHRPCAVICR
jgi:hypothetical protein